MAAATSTPTRTPREAPAPTPPRVKGGTPFQHGKVEDFYTVETRPFSQGLRALVYRAIKKKTGEHVVVRQIYCPGDVEEECAKSEVDLMNKIERDIDNEFLMYHVDAFWDASARLLTLVLPYCAGGELFDRILAVKFFSEVKAATLFRKLASAVAGLHAAGIVHRNIKPENILLWTRNLSNSTDVILADFALATQAGTADPRGEVRVGTPAYMAPELLDEDTPPAYSAASDVWSLGVVLYILLSGVPPFYGVTAPTADPDSHASILSSITDGVKFPSPYFDSVSGNARDLISRCLARDPAQRITAAQVVDHIWVTDNAMNQDDEAKADSSVDDVAQAEAAAKQDADTAAKKEADAAAKKEAQERAEEANRLVSVAVNAARAAERAATAAAAATVQMSNRSVKVRGSVLVLSVVVAAAVGFLGGRVFQARRR